MNFRLPTRFTDSLQRASWVCLKKKASQQMEVSPYDFPSKTEPPPPIYTKQIQIQAKPTASFCRAAGAVCATRLRCADWHMRQAPRVFLAGAIGREGVGMALINHPTGGSFKGTLGSFPHSLLSTSKFFGVPRGLTGTVRSCTSRAALGGFFLRQHFDL